MINRKRLTPRPPFALVATGRPIVKRRNGVTARWKCMLLRSMCQDAREVLKSIRLNMTLGALRCVIAAIREYEESQPLCDLRHPNDFGSALKLRRFAVSSRNLGTSQGVGCRPHPPPEHLLHSAPRNGRVLVVLSVRPNLAETCCRSLLVSLVGLHSTAGPWPATRGAGY